MKRREEKPPDVAENVLASSHGEQKKERDEPLIDDSSSPETSTTHHARSEVHKGSNPTITGYAASRDAIPPKTKKDSAAASMASSAATSVATSPMNEASMTRETAESDSPQMERALKPTPRPHLPGEGTQKDDLRVTEDAASQSTTFHSSQEDSAHNQPPPSVNREEESEVSVSHDGFWPKQPKKRRLGVAQGGYDRERHAAALWESMPAQSYTNREAFQTASTSQGGVSASLNSLPVAASLRSQVAHYRPGGGGGGGGVPVGLNSLPSAAGIGDDAVSLASLFGPHYGLHAPAAPVNDTSRAYSQAGHEEEQRKRRSVPSERASVHHEKDTPLRLQQEQEEVAADHSENPSQDPQLSSYHSLINSMLGESTSDMTSTSLLSRIQEQQRARHAALSASNEQRLIGEVLQRKIHQNNLLSQSGVLGSRSSHNSDIPPSLLRSTLLEQRNAPTNLDSISVPTHDPQIQDFLRQQDMLSSAQLSLLLRLSVQQALVREALGSTPLRYPTSSTVDVSRTAHNPGSLLSRIGLSNEAIQLSEAALHSDNQADSTSRRKGELPGYEVAGSLSPHTNDLQPQEPIVIPPCIEGPLPHYGLRTILPLSAIQDTSWLSEFLCFVRSKMFEIFRASHWDVASRNNSRKITYQQVGIRCRFCAHIPYEDRLCRSSTFPSSLDRIYQSIVMIIREHFVNCRQIPEELRAQYFRLKKEQCKGIPGSEKYWADAARRKGLVDTPNGIRFDESLISR